jgi:hypothetical protein
MHWSLFGLPFFRFCPVFALGKLPSVTSLMIVVVSSLDFSIGHVIFSWVFLPLLFSISLCAFSQVCLLYS